MVKCWLMTVQIGGELVEVECQGLYDRKYAAQSLHCEGNTGATSTKKLWDDGRNSQCWYEENTGEKFQTICSCCTAGADLRGGGGGFRGLQPPKMNLSSPTLLQKGPAHSCNLMVVSSRYAFT